MESLRVIAYAVLIWAVVLPARGEMLDTGEPAMKVDLNVSGVIEIELNLRERPTLWLSAVNGDQSVSAEFDVEGHRVTTSDLLIQLTRCSAPRTCRVTVDPSDTNQARLYVTAPPLGLRVGVTAEIDGASVTRFVKIELNDRWWDLGWSGGYMMSSQRDDHYDLRPAAGGTSTAVQIRRDDAKRAIVAIGTMHITRAPSFGFSFGVGTESAELNQLSVLMGGTLAFRPRRVVDAVLLSLGAAYLPRLTLNPAFAGDGRVPAGVELDDVLMTKRNIKPFFSLTFRTSGNGNTVRAPLGGTAQ